MRFEVQQFLCNKILIGTDNWISPEDVEKLSG